MTFHTVLSLGEITHNALSVTGIQQSNYLWNNCFIFYNHTDKCESLCTHSSLSM